MNKIRIIYLILCLALLGGYFTAGFAGFRLLSAFSGYAYVHTMRPGIHHK